MTDLYVEIPLFDDPFYDLTVSLEGNSYIIQFTFVERMNLYTMSLFDSDNVPIVQGVAVVPEYPITLDYAIPDLTGYFLIRKKATLLSEPYKTFPDKLSEFYRMFYIFPED